MAGMAINQFVFGQGFNTAGNGQDPRPEAKSLLDEKPLHRIAFEAERKSKLDSDLDEAQKNYDLDPNNVDNIVWLGRRLGYLWRYNDAIDVFSKGIRIYPNEPQLFRHRGHRYITIRQFDLAIKDLKNAARLIEGKPDEIEPDGIPNAPGIPTSTLHTNIWYHLGLAYYLKGDFDAAQEAYVKCLAAAKNNDMRVATLDWMYMTLRRLKRDDEAAKLIEQITPDLEIVENHAYHRRLLVYRGLAKPETLAPNEKSTDRDLDLATYGYGLGNWHLLDGRPEKAKAIFESVVAGQYWSAFGFIAAEVELARMRRNDHSSDE
jgi:tetratricopeptide (TPR) repeat protein